MDSKSSETSQVFFKEFSEIYQNSCSVIRQLTALSGSLILTNTDRNMPEYEFSLIHIFPYKNGIVDSVLIHRSSCSDVFCKKDVLKNFAKFTGRHLCQSLFLINSWCFPVNFAKFLRTPLFTENLWWLLLYTRK